MNRERPVSRASFSEACRLIPGGVNSPARAFGGVGGTPVFIQRADGPYLYDVDGYRYVDFIGSWGPMILGHAHPKVRAALHEAIELGSSYGAPTIRESELAQAIVTAVPSIEKVRLVSSGTEATMSAIRLARGYTGRNKFIKFAGNYHGHADPLLVSAGSSAATLGVPNSPGVTPGAVQDTIVLEYNDVPALQDVFEREADAIAAVIMEPVVGNMGCIVPSQAFLETARRVTEDAGALLIFDEVMTGFRLALGGAQEIFGITPDITTLGKIVGGGLPLGAYGGKSEILDHVLPAGKVFQAGTLSGNPLATAAGLATLRELQSNPPYAYLEQITEQLADGLGDAARQMGIAHYITMIGSMITIFFSDHPVVDWPSAARCDTPLFARFFHGMLDRGFYLPCSQFEAWFLSAAHTPEMIEQTIQAAREVFEQLQA